MFIDIACHQMKKYNQNAYGDYFASKRVPGESRLLAVLSDGLGSGIKANILSCMTATMLLRFMERHIPVGRAAEIVMNSLPVCKVRKISYSTFSAVDCTDDGDVVLVEEGNPDFILWRSGAAADLPFSIINSKTFKNRHTRVYKFKASLGDRIVMCSDGVTQAGLGGERLKLGLRREGLEDYLSAVLTDCPDMSSDALSHHIVEYARLIEPDGLPKDDVSACVLYFREPRKTLVFTGPPYHQEQDAEYARIFDSFDGKKAVCGGTTANLLSRELNRPITMDISADAGDLPACSFMDGADLITEGILTLTKAAEYLETGIPEGKRNAAVRLVEFLLDSDSILFMIGAKLNQAHYDPTLPVEIEIRKNVIRQMADSLRKKYYKDVRLQFM